MKALGIFLLFCGMGMIKMAFIEPVFELGSRIFIAICGIARNLAVVDCAIRECEVFS